MTDEDIFNIAQFSRINIRLNTIRDVQEVEGETIKFLSAYIKELPGIVVHVESWDEDEIKSEARKSYEFLSEYVLDKHNLEMPVLENIEIVYFDDLEKWLEN